MRSFLDRFLPFIFLGIAITLGFFSLILLGYLFLFGLIVGAILYLIAWIRMRFFKSKSASHFPKQIKSGRTFDEEK